MNHTNSVEWWVKKNEIIVVVVLALAHAEDAWAWKSVEVYFGRCRAKESFSHKATDDKTWLSRSRLRALESKGLLKQDCEMFHR